MMINREAPAENFEPLHLVSLPSVPYESHIHHQVPYRTVHHGDYKNLLRCNIIPQVRLSLIQARAFLVNDVSCGFTNPAITPLVGLYGQALALVNPSNLYPRFLLRSTINHLIHFLRSAQLIFIHFHSNTCKFHQNA